MSARSTLRPRARKCQPSSRLRVESASPANASYLAMSANQSSTNAFVYHNVSLTDGTPAQTLMGPAVNDRGPHAPEPSTWAVIAIGAGLVRFKAWRRGSPAKTEFFIQGSA